MQSGRHRWILVTSISQLLHYIPAHKSKNFPPKYLPSASQQLLRFLTNYLICILPLYNPKSRERQTPHQVIGCSSNCVSPNADWSLLKTQSGMIRRKSIFPASLRCLVGGTTHRPFCSGQGASSALPVDVPAFPRHPPVPAESGAGKRNKQGRQFSTGSLPPHASHCFHFPPMISVSSTQDMSQLHASSTSNVRDRKL